MYLDNISLEIKNLKIGCLSLWLVGWFMVFNATFNNIFIDIVAVGFIGRGNQSARRKPSTYRKSLTNFIT
jgi:hypothetical protein